MPRKHVRADRQKDVALEDAILLSSFVTAHRGHTRKPDNIRRLLVEIFHLVILNIRPLRRLPTGTVQCERLLSRYAEHQFSLTDRSDVSVSALEPDCAGMCLLSSHAWKRGHPAVASTIGFEPGCGNASAS